MEIKKDTMGQPYIEWKQSKSGLKRAWVQHRTADNDWASSPGRRYLNVVRVDAPDVGPAGKATDFPIFSNLSDEQILEAFVVSVCAITGCPLS